MAVLRSASSWGEVSISGPFFQAGSMLDPKTGRDIEEAIATYAALRVRQRGIDSFKNPSGFYVSQVVLDVSDPEQVIVTDQGTVYGPWLEGTSSRNQTTRFKGYRLWRLAKQDANLKAVSIASGLISKMVARLR